MIRTPRRCGNAALLAAGIALSACGAAGNEIEQSYESLQTVVERPDEEVLALASAGSPNTNEPSSPVGSLCWAIAELAWYLADRTVDQTYPETAESGWEDLGFDWGAVRASAGRSMAEVLTELELAVDWFDVQSGADPALVAFRDSFLADVVAAHAADADFVAGPPDPSGSDTMNFIDEHFAGLLESTPYPGSVEFEAAAQVSPDCD